MAFGNSSTSADSLLKEFYSPKYVENVAFKKNALFGMVPKKEDCSGRYVYQALKYGYGQARSATFLNAQTNASLTGENYVDFNVPMVEDFGVANVSSKLISQTENDEGAFLKATTDISDGQLKNFANQLSVQLYRPAAGSRGTISTGTTIASSTLKFANPRDTNNIEVGMELVLAAAESTGGLRALGSNNHGLYVTKVDRGAGSITVGTTPTPNGTACNISDASDGIPLAAQGDYIFVVGDRNLRFSGLADWNPQGGPATSDSFMGGVNRSIDPVRLAGQSYDATTAGGSLLSILETAGSRIGEQGGELTHFMMPFKQFQNLSNELGAKTQLVSVSSTGQVGYTGIKIASGDGFIVCVPDRSCPSDRIHGINIDSMEFCSVGKAVRIWQVDGLIWLRSATQSGQEIRFYSFGALRVTDPLNFINIKVTP